MNNKAQTATDTPIILSILVFQAFVILMLGFININDSTNTVVGSNTINFTQNILTNIKLLGWGNSLIFAPLLVCIIYIVAKLIRGGG